MRNATMNACQEFEVYYQPIVDDLGKEPFADAFIKIVCELATIIGMHVCVEGVESEKQFEILKSIQIQMIQGFYFGKPMKKEEFAKKYL